MTDQLALLPSPSRPGPSGSSSSLGSQDSAPASGAGTKTGIAFGVLGGVAVGLVVFIFNRRRQAAAHVCLGDEDEKFRPCPANVSNPFDSPDMRGDAKAPRISLRPFGQLTPVGAAWDRPSTSRSTNPANPFGIQAERVPSPVAEEQNMRGAISSTPAHSRTNGCTVAAPGASRKDSMRKDGPGSVDLTLPRRNEGLSPPSPAKTEFSTSSVAAGSAPPVTKGAAAIAAAGGPASSGVHRVELEFTPTLSDEMEMHIGGPGSPAPRVRRRMGESRAVPTGRPKPLTRRAVSRYPPQPFSAGRRAPDVPVGAPCQAAPHPGRLPARASGEPQPRPCHGDRGQARVFTAPHGGPDLGSDSGSQTAGSTSGPGRPEAGDASRTRLREDASVVAAVDGPPLEAAWTSASWAPPGPPRPGAVDRKPTPSQHTNWSKEDAPWAI